MIVGAEVHAVTSRFNEMYGHAAILRNYLGADDNRLKIVGQLQHGWTIRAGVYYDPQPYYLWNQRSAKGPLAADNVDPVSVHLVGAPYLYLPPPPDIMDIGRIPLSLLALPQHTTSGHRLRDPYQEWYEYGKWLAKIRDEAKLSQVTCCLHENDYNDFGVVASLGRSGVTVATAGDARMMSTTFLDRQRALFMQHGVVTSNAIGTGLIYAAYEGKPVFIDGPEPQLEAQRGTTEWMNEQMWDAEWIDREFPGWRCHWHEAAAHVEDGRRELGLEYKKTRSELWDLLQFAVMP